VLHVLRQLCHVIPPREPKGAGDSENSRALLSRKNCMFSIILLNPNLLVLFIADLSNHGTAYHKV
jgi:hypothetical protein